MYICCLFKWLKKCEVTIFLQMKLKLSLQKSHASKKTDDYHINDTWSMDLSHDYGPKINIGYRYMMVVIEIFSEFG